MINLLPPDYKQTISYGRVNRRLLIWSVSLLAALIFTLAIIGIGQIYLSQSINKLEQEVAAADENLSDQNIGETKAQVEEISSNVKLALDVLSKEVLFSKLLVQLGSSLPPSTVLENIEIEEVQGGLSIKAKSVDFASGTQIQVNLEDPRNNIFQDVDIESIICSENAENQEKYPCKVLLKGLFLDKNPYKYLSEGAGR